MSATGERVWHYQFVHHGVWDYDLPAAPTLVDITVEGHPIKAVAQVTKQGFVYVFDRVTGEPVWEIEERPVPASTVPGERLSPTQPFPTRPPPFEQQGITLDDLIDFTPELRSEAEAILNESDYGGLFHPPSLRGTIQMPGWTGGASWQGAAFDPDTGYYYVPSRTAPIHVRLVDADPNESDFRYVRDRSRPVQGPQRLPLTKPPYARVTAYDLNRGEIVWMAPHGDGLRQRVIDMGLPDPGPLGGGTWTGPLLTKTLLFVGHGGRAIDGQPPVLRAFDRASGDVVHVVELPENPNGTPMTYIADGQQLFLWPVAPVSSRVLSHWHCRRKTTPKASVVSSTNLYIRPTLRPGQRRCSSLVYAQYARSSRLAGRAHHRSRCTDLLNSPH